VAFGAALRPAILDRNGASLDPTQFTHSRHKSSRPWTKGCSIRAQEPNDRQFGRVLRTRRQRPSSCRTADQRDEIASPHQLPSSRGSYPAMLWAALCITANSDAQCLLWVISGHFSDVRPMSALPPEADIRPSSSSYQWASCRIVRRRDRNRARIANLSDINRRANDTVKRSLFRESRRNLKARQNCPSVLWRRVSFRYRECCSGELILCRAS